MWGRAQRSPLRTAGLGLATAGAVGPAGARRAPVVVQGEGSWSFSKLASVGYLPLPLTDLRTVPGGTGVWGRVCGLEQTRRTAWGGQYLIEANFSTGCSLHLVSLIHTSESLPSFHGCLSQLCEESVTPPHCLFLKGW